MIKLVKGNILKADAEAIVNTVNCVGVMGKGIALQFKQAYPENFHAYKHACDTGTVRPGSVFVYPTGSMLNPKYIINFPTKTHWKGKSKIEHIEAGLQALVKEIKRRNIRSIAVPPLGCGNGRLQWDDVHQRIVGALSELHAVNTFLYAPRGAPAADAMPVRTTKPEMTRARASLVNVIRQYGVPGYRLTLLEIQKLAYFLQTAGEPLRLRFVKHSYGPYADNLHFVLQRLEGHFLRGYGDRGRHAHIHVLPGPARQADLFLEDCPDAQSNLSRVNRLIEGFETPYGMELLATVHWVGVEDVLAANDVKEAVDRVLAWNARKRKLSRRHHIEIAWVQLREGNWLST